MITTPDEFQNRWNSLQFSLATWGFLTVGAGTLACMPYVTNQPAKAVLAASGVVSGVFSRRMNFGADKMSARERDEEDVSSFAFTQQLFNSMVNNTAPGSSIPLGWEPDPNMMCNIQEINTNRERHPHVLVLGGTGDGKSTLTEWLIDSGREQNTKKLYISPTRDDYEFTDYNLYGCGLRNDGSPYNMDFDSIVEVLQWLLGETYTRYNLASGQAKERGYIEGVLDEYRLTAKLTAAADNVKLIDPALQTEMSYSQGIIYLVTVARKKFIRLWLLVQSETVKALDMAGEGDVRESFTYIRLGSFARDHLKSLVEKKQYPSEILEWWDRQPAHSVVMVNDKIAVIPNLLQYQQVKATAKGFKGVNYRENVKPMTLPQTQVITGLPANTVRPPVLVEREPDDEDPEMYEEPPVVGSSPAENPETPIPIEFQTFDEISRKHGGIPPVSKMLKEAKLTGRNYARGKELYAAYLQFSSSRPQ